MSRKALELGISAIQQGNTAEGARLIRIALNDPSLTADVRAIACVWLAETSPDPAFRRACYTAALEAQPGSADIQARLAALDSLPAPAPAAPVRATASTAPVHSAPNGADHLLTVIDGPNGAGTAVAVTPDGMIATTRRVIGGLERATIALPGGRQVYAVVVRSFPELDLALLQLPSPAPALLPISPLPRVPDDAPLVAISADGAVTRATQRPTRRALAPHWIPTTVTALSDAGGAALFDDRMQLVGIMTTCFSLASSSYLYGIHISAIRRAAESARAEAAAERLRYCPNCGSGSRAAGQGYFYCEVCGSVTPEARSVRRYPVPTAAAYYEPVGKARCPQCNATVGSHNGHCLRCGAAMGR
jgi:hypothetical protein